MRSHANPRRKIGFETLVYTDHWITLTKPSSFLNAEGAGNFPDGGFFNQDLNPLDLEGFDAPQAVRYYGSGAEYDYYKAQNESNPTGPQADLSQYASSGRLRTDQSFHRISDWAQPICNLAQIKGRAQFSGPSLNVTGPLYTYPTSGKAREMTNPHGFRFIHGKDNDGPAALAGSTYLSNPDWSLAKQSESIYDIFECRMVFSGVFESFYYLGSGLLVDIQYPEINWLAQHAAVVREYVDTGGRLVVFTNGSSEFSSFMAALGCSIRTPSGFNFFDYLDPTAGGGSSYTGTIRNTGSLLGSRGYYTQPLIPATARIAQGLVLSPQSSDDAPFTLGERTARRIISGGVPMYLVDTADRATTSSTSDRVCVAAVERVGQGFVFVLDWKFFGRTTWTKQFSGRSGYGYHLPSPFYLPVNVQPFASQHYDRITVGGVEKLNVRWQPFYEIFRRIFTYPDEAII